jgi:large subunit ribosomal protein L30
MKDTIKITLVKSLIGRSPKHVQMAHQLGLKKMNRTVEMPNNACVRGIVNSINYLLKVEG